MVCHLWAEGPGKPGMKFKFRFKAWEPGKLMSEPEGLRISGLMMSFLVQVWRPKNHEYQCPRAKKDGCLSSSGEHIRLSPPYLFYLSPQRVGWGPVTLAKTIFLLSLPIQMLISFRNTFADTSRNNILPAYWASFSPVNLTHKIDANGKNKHTNIEQMSWLGSQKSK